MKINFKVNYLKRKHQQYVVYDIHNGKIVKDAETGLQLIYTTEKKAIEAVNWINAQAAKSN